MERLSWLTEEQARAVQRQFGTPTFVYDQRTLEEQARQALTFPNPYGLTVRYAMKACPSAAVIRILNSQGLHIDASSGYEARRARRAGVPAAQIQISAQQLPDDLRELDDQGVLFNACSLHQLRAFGRLFPGREISFRVNPGLGSGHSNRTNVGGPSASFGIWHEHLDQVLEIAREFALPVTGLHTHIGSGGDPEVWQHCARLTLSIAARLPQVRRVSLGGGFKVGRMAGEKSTDLQMAGQPVAGSAPPPRKGPASQGSSGPAQRVGETSRPPAEGGSAKTGTVKRWVADRAYGFITPDGGGSDLFVHVSGVVGNAALQVGQRVRFEIAQGPKGPQARNVRPLS